MKNYFAASLCKGGILGGGLIVDEEGITYKTGKVTVSPKYRNFKMTYDSIVGITKGSLFVFPTVEIFLEDGESYKFIVFGRKRFCSLVEQAR